MLATQHCEYNFLFKAFLSALSPDILFLLGEADKLFFEKKGMATRTLPPAVDNLRFCKVSPDQKKDLRRKYNIHGDKIVVLHVGHIRPARNLKCLVNIQKMSDTQVIIVGSTTTPRDKKLEQLLKESGITVFGEYLPGIEELYQLSDVYVFPVSRYNAAIDMPLSILEALSCNLPVITTRFGSLADYFTEDNAFKYFEKSEELEDLIRSVKDLDSSDIQNDKKIGKFSWDKFVAGILNTFREV